MARTRGLGKALSYGVLGGLAGAALLQVSQLGGSTLRISLLLAACAVPVALGFAWRRTSDAGGWATAAGCWASGVVLLIAVAGILGAGFSFGEAWKIGPGLLLALPLVALASWPFGLLFWTGTLYARLATPGRSVQVS